MAVGCMPSSKNLLVAPENPLSLSPKKSTKISMSVFPRFLFVPSRFRVFRVSRAAMRVQFFFNHTFYKKIVSRSFNQKINNLLLITFWGVSW
jgi:hypothetical protein